MDGSTLYSNPISINHIYPNGTLIQVKYPYSPAGPNVYLVSGGTKKWIPNPSVFTTQYNSWNKIVAVSSFELGNYTDGTYVPYRDGELTREQSDSKIYVFEGGQKKWIPTPAIFNSYGYSWSNVVVVPNTSLNYYPPGPDVTNYAGTHLSGTLVKSSSSPAVYLLESGQKRLIPDPYVYSTRFIYWGKIINISSSELASYPTNPTVVPFRDGELTREQSSSLVYVFENGKKRYITDATTFNAYGYSWSNIVIVPNNELSQFPTGEPLSL